MSIARYLQHFLNSGEINDVFPKEIKIFSFTLNHGIYTRRLYSVTLIEEAVYMRISKSELNKKLMERKNAISCIVLVVTLMFVACSPKKGNTDDGATNNEQEVKNKAAEAPAAWSYQGETGPERWEEIEPQSDCGGRYQSPIDIITSNAAADPDMGPIDFHYLDSTHIHDVINNGHSIQYNFEKGDYITINDKRYDLIQIHFHEPSEHTVDGVRYPMVIHMVHASQEGGYAVLAVLVKETNVNDAAFDVLERYMPIHPGDKKIVNRAFDLKKNLPSSKEYYHYTGSLTTPPCTEGVLWFIYKEPIDIAKDQIKAFQEIMPINNYRSEQPLNGRMVSSAAG